MTEGGISEPFRHGCSTRYSIHTLLKRYKSAQSPKKLSGGLGSTTIEVTSSPISLPILLGLNAQIKSDKMPRLSQVSAAFRNRRSLPPWKLRMIYDMFVSKRLTIADMAEGAGCSGESIKEICHLLQILAFRGNGDPHPPSPTVDINILPARTTRELPILRRAGGT